MQFAGLHFEVRSSTFNVRRSSFSSPDASCGNMTLNLTQHRRELSVAAVYLTMLAALAIFRPVYFQMQFISTWIQSAPVLIAAVGMTWVILARQIDISIGSQFSVCGVLAALTARMGLPMPAVALVAILTGGLLGAVNGALVGFAGLPSIVVTLAMMVLLQQGLSWLRQGEAVNGLPAGFQWFGASQHAGEWIILISAIVVLGLFIVAARYLTGGRAVYAVGSDHEAARLAGLRPRHVTFSVFLLMGALTGLAALLNAVRFPQADVNAGVGLELSVIAAVVVGGTAVSGGRGTLVGTFFGIALLGTISSALFFLGVKTQWERAVQGLVILAAVASDALATKRGN
jgi:rhamnose transport system permease protein